MVRKMLVNGDIYDALDVWGVIQNKVAEGWFVPSSAEWGAFGDNLRITENKSLPGLTYNYWSSSQYSDALVWYMRSSTMEMRYYAIGTNGTFYVRLSTTF